MNEGTQAMKMNLLTKAIEAKLRKNGDINRKHREIDGNTEDFKPVVKFFNPVGGATWLISEISDEGTDMDGNHDLILFGLCDLGMGFPEMGNVSLNELKGVNLRFGLGIERDMHWTATKTLTEYANDARASGRITV